MKRVILTAVMFATVAGCASILEGTTQTINITTTPDGAECRFVRERKIIGRVNPTPGSLNVKKLKHDIAVKCTKDGYKEARRILDSGLESKVLGNIILSGGIGWAVDSATGADNKYPENVHINLVPK